MSKIPIDGLTSPVDLTTAAEMIKSGSAVPKNGGRVQLVDPYDKRGLGSTLFSSSAIRGTLTLPFAGRDDALLSYDLLRLIARRSSVVKPAIDFVVRSLSGTPYRIRTIDGVRIPKKTIKLAEEMLIQPLAEMGSDTFPDVLSKLLRDQIVLDSGIILKHRNSSGVLEAFEPMDSATFLPVQDKISGRLKNWVQRVKNSEEREFNKEDIISFIINRRSDSLFGEPPLEAAIHEINAILNASRSFAKAMSDNEIPPGVLFLFGGDNPRALARLEHQVRRDRGVSNDYALKVISGIESAKWISFQRPLREMQVAELLERIEKIIFRNLGVDRIAMGCHSEDTQILTKEGWKYHYEVDVSTDLLATYAPDSTISYVKPVKKYEYPYEGTMMKFNSRSVCGMVTPNHNMYVSRRRMGDIYRDFEMIQAENMYKGDFKFKTSGYQEGKVRETAKILGKTLPMDDWLTFLGLVISEGSIYTHDGKGHVIQFGASKKSTVNAIRMSLNAIGFKYHEFQIKRGIAFEHYVRQPSTQFKIWNKALCKLLASMCGCTSKEKRLPNFIWDLDYTQLKILFDALIEGDGHINKAGYGSGSYTTVSPQLADDFQRLATVLGYYSHIHEVNRPELTNNPIYTVSFVNSCEVVLSHRQGHISETEYKGTVWCFEVEPYHTLITRLNGKTMISGNSVQDINRSASEAIVMTRHFSLFKPLLDIWANKFTFELLKEIHEGLFIEFIHFARTGMETDLVGPTGSVSDETMQVGPGGNNDNNQNNKKLFGRICGACDGLRKISYRYNGEDDFIDCPYCGGRGIGGPIFVSRPNNGIFSISDSLNTVRRFNRNPSVAWEEFATVQMKEKLRNMKETTKRNILSSCEFVSDKEDMLKVGKLIEKELNNLYNKSFSEISDLVLKAGVLPDKKALNEAKSEIYDLIRFKVNRSVLSGYDINKIALDVSQDAVFLCENIEKMAGKTLANCIQQIT